MNEMNLGTIETHFAELIWENAPIRSGELVALCQKELGWKRKVDFKRLVAMMVDSDMRAIAGISPAEAKKRQLEGEGSK